MSDDARPVAVDGPGFDAWMATIVRTPTINRLRAEITRLRREHDMMARRCSEYDAMLQLCGEAFVMLMVCEESGAASTDLRADIEAWRERFANLSGG